MINKSLQGIYNNDFNKTTNQYFTAYTTNLNLNALQNNGDSEAKTSTLLTPKIQKTNEPSNGLPNVWNTLAKSNAGENSRYGNSRSQNRVDRFAEAKLAAEIQLKRE